MNRCESAGADSWVPRGDEHMGDKVRSSTAAEHLQSLESVRPAMAKAVLRNPEMTSRQVIGLALQRAVALARWSHKEAAYHVKVDDSQFGKWCSGAERAQLDKVWDVQELRVPFVIALAELIEMGVEVQTVITLRRAG
jgi:hypothetical protein